MTVLARRGAFVAMLLAGVFVHAGGASATTWSGTCELKGRTDFSPPLRTAIQSEDFQSYLSGTCTGTLDGKPFDGPASAYTDGRMGKPMSCLVGASDEMPNTLHFGTTSLSDTSAVLLDNYTTLMGSALNQTEFLWRGAFNGYGNGEATILGSGQQTFEQCAGAGLQSVEVQIKERTLTPMFG